MKLTFGKVRPADDVPTDEHTTRLHPAKAERRGYGRVAPRELVDAAARAAGVRYDAARAARALLARARAETA